MTSRTTRRFREALAGLPAHVRAQARLAYQTFARDPSHPALRFKQVHAQRPIYSARVGLGLSGARRACGRGPGLVLDRLACGVRSAVTAILAPITSTWWLAAAAHVPRVCSTTVGAEVSTRPDSLFFSLPFSSLLSILLSTLQMLTRRFQHPCSYPSPLRPPST